MPNDAQILVLYALTDGPLHGYAINTAIDELTGERLGPGSLYGALARLEAKGLVEALDGEGRQRPVRITEQGRVVLERELRAMARVADAGLRRLGVRPA
ncbi:helix-turn-helix transcriptional regulator [Amycolatopsis sp., V23-08]|uniref:Helix-turn-helix transcriptional regulator n=1 Tax=Amycolatopsis heterodermiae TaxID=3110235 RepID=A0ABU5RBF5_9PSEU|nr:helix-turn-helix transcriptional regulator [Amycolatopsis sp., V23-08]MEA5362959.1 helix-turn-helix transcriptional regulator [Amycolatopsis sp., V23-08]